MQTYQYFVDSSQLNAVLASPELADKRIINIEITRSYSGENGRDLGPLINITVVPSPTGQQIIDTTVEERLEAAELMIDLLLDTQQESA